MVNRLVPLLALKRRAIRQQLLAIFRSEGIDAGIDACRKLLTAFPDPQEAVSLDEVSLNYIGYYLLAHQDVDAAVAVFELLVEAFPYSANAHHSLSEAYCEAGHRERAAISDAMFQVLGPLQHEASTRAVVH